MQNQQTFGQQMVRFNVNPTNNEQIQRVKDSLWRVIDELNELKKLTSDPQIRRNSSKAIVDFESGVGYAEKAFLLFEIEQSTINQQDDLLQQPQNVQRKRQVQLQS